MHPRMCQGRGYTGAWDAPMWGNHLSSPLSSQPKAGSNNGGSSGSWGAVERAQGQGLGRNPVLPCISPTFSQFVKPGQASVFLSLKGYKFYSLPRVVIKEILA